MSRTLLTFPTQSFYNQILLTYESMVFFPVFSSSLPLVSIRAETSAENLGSGRAGPQDMEPFLSPHHFAETSAPSQESCN